MLVATCHYITVHKQKSSYRYLVTFLASSSFCFFSISHCICSISSSDSCLSSSKVLTPSVTPEMADKDPRSPMVDASWSEPHFGVDCTRPHGELVNLDPGLRATGLFLEVFLQKNRIV